MTSCTPTIERPGADASAPTTAGLDAPRSDRSPAEREPQENRRLLSSLWRSLRQAPAFY